MKKGSPKNNAVNSAVKRELTQILRDVKDPAVDPFATVTKVEVTPDLQFCNIHISTLGSEESLSETIEGLDRAKGFIRRELAHRVNLRKTPELRFLPDRSVEYAIEMSKRIDELLAEDRAKHGITEENPEEETEEEFDEESDEEEAPDETDI